MEAPGYVLYPIPYPCFTQTPGQIRVPEGSAAQKGAESGGHRILVYIYIIIYIFFGFVPVDWRPSLLVWRPFLWVGGHSYYGFRQGSIEQLEVRAVRPGPCRPDLDLVDLLPTRCNEWS